MRKKLLVVMMVGIVSAFAFAGCSDDESDTSTVTTSQSQDSNDSVDDAEDAEDADDADVEDAEDADVADDSEDGGFSLLDVSSDMIEIGAYAMSDDGTELVFSMFQGPDGEEYVSLFGFDNNEESGDVICGTYSASTETDDDGIQWTLLEVQDVYTGETYQLGVAEADGEVAFIDAEGNVVEAEYLDSDQTINYMGAAAALIQ